MKNTARDILEKELLNDAKQGDTTVLAEILTLTDDRLIYNSLSDEKQEEVGKPNLRTLYYTVEKELCCADPNDGIEETTGYKDICLYDIVDGKPKLLTEIQAENEYSTLDELTHWVSITAPELVEEGEVINLDLEQTFTFEEL